MTTTCNIDFVSEKSAAKVSNDDHMTLGCCSHHKFKALAKRLNFDHGTEDRAAVISARASRKSLLSTPSSFQMGLIEWS